MFWISLESLRMAFYYFSAFAKKPIQPDRAHGGARSSLGRLLTFPEVIIRLICGRCNTGGISASHIQDRIQGLGHDGIPARLRHSVLIPASRTILWYARFWRCYAASNLHMCVPFVRLYKESFVISVNLDKSGTRAGVFTRSYRNRKTFEKPWAHVMSK